MPSVFNPIADLYHHHLEASRRFGEVLFSGTERLDHVVRDAAHRAFTAQLNLAHAAVSMRDPKELVTIQSSMLSQGPETAVNFQKEIVRVFAEIQNEMGKSVKECMEKFNSNVARNATAPLKAAQDKATETVLNPLTGIFSLWESAFREVASLANKNMTTVRSVAEEVTHSTVQVHSSAAEETAQAAQTMARQAGRAADEISRDSAQERLNGNGHSNVSNGEAGKAGKQVHVEAKEVQEERERRPHSGGSRRK